MAKWMSGRPTGVPGSGWVGRWLDGYLGAGKDLFAAAEVGHSLPLHMIGERSVATTVPASRPDVRCAPRLAHGRGPTTLLDHSCASAGAHAADSWVGRIGQSQVDGLDVATALSPVIPTDDQLSPSRGRRRSSRWLHG